MELGNSEVSKTAGVNKTKSHRGDSHIERALEACRTFSLNIQKTVDQSTYVRKLPGAKSMIMQKD